MTTDQSIETVTKDLQNRFAPKVILINHEKELPVDNACANLAIKYNMIYLSAYQVIKDHITRNTEQGKVLMKTMKNRDVIPALQVNDEFQEEFYSPVHFDPEPVKRLIADTIAEVRTNQKFVILEGLCNSMKLSNPDDQMEIRFMDELFGIEGFIGEVVAVLSLQYEA